MFVFFPFILDIKSVGRTSRGHTGGRSHRIFRPPSFCGACLDFSRENDSAIPFPRRPLSRILCTNDKSRLPGSNSRPNVSEDYYKVTSELPGRLLYCICRLRDCIVFVDYAEQWTAAALDEGEWRERPKNRRSISWRNGSLQRGSQGWTTACSCMPERHEKDQGEDSPKQAGSCWFAHPS